MGNEENSPNYRGIRLLVLLFAITSVLGCDGDSDVTASQSQPSVEVPQVRPFATCVLERGLDVVDTSNQQLPGYLETVTDQAFRTQVIRVTDNPGSRLTADGTTWPRIARHHYSKTQAWNADQTLFHLPDINGAGLLLDGATFTLLDAELPEVDESRWHPTDPNLRFYIRDNEVGWWNVQTHTLQPVATFSDYSRVRLGPFEGNLSLDGTRVVLVVDDGDPIAFAYDLDQRTAFPPIDIGTARLDWAGISPLGDLVVVNGEFDDEDQTKVFDLQGTELQFWAEPGRPSHYDLTLDSDGSEIAVGTQKGGDLDGRVIKRNLTDGDITALSPGGYASHTSARNVDNPEWVYVTYPESSDAWPPFGSEIVALSIDGSMQVARIAKTQSIVSAYATEPHASPSPDGSKVVWASNWGIAEGPIMGFVVVVDSTCE